jgi:hypothetical protein
MARCLPVLLSKSVVAVYPLVEARSVVLPSL